MSWLERLRKPERESWLLLRAESRSGRLLLSALFLSLIVLILQQNWLAPNGLSWRLLLCPLLCAYAGTRRKLILALTTWSLIVLDPEWFQTDWLHQFATKYKLVVDFSLEYRLMNVGVVVFCAVLIQWQRHHPESRLARWPVLSMLTFYFALVWLGDAPFMTPYARYVLYSFLNSFGAYMWFLAYALRDNNPKNRSPLWFEMGTFHAFFNGRGILPIGLGAANLRSLEAKNDRELAVTQIKAIKLLIDCGLCAMALYAIEWLARTYFGLPTLGKILTDVPGSNFSRGIYWATLLTGFVQNCLKAAVAGNLLVGCARFAGFRLLQQTYKPFQSRSISDFWNRISYYFKQPMVDLFFYPAFLGSFKKHPRLRTVFAIFMAVVVGNVLFHFHLFLATAAQVGLVNTLLGTKVYLVYCLALWVALSASGSSRLKSPIVALALIATFYSALKVFDEYYSDPTPLMAYFHYLAFLFGGSP